VPQRPKEQAELPFVMYLQRGRKMRVEIEFKGQTAIQVYNGTQGWKVRPFLNRHEVESFTPEELKAASTQTDLDGLLIDYAAKGSKVELESTDQVDGRVDYNLTVTDKNGKRSSRLDRCRNLSGRQIEGTPRQLDGKYHLGATYFRDYRSVNGLVMPYLLETEVEGVRETEKILIENIVSNPRLDDSQSAPCGANLRFLPHAQELSFGRSARRNSSGIRRRVAHDTPGRQCHARSEREPRSPSSPWDRLPDIIEDHVTDLAVCLVG
jgi:hypothetical protein